MTNFEVITPAGVTVHTFNTAEGARKYVLAKKATLPGLRIDAVTVRVERVAVYRPRAARPVQVAA